MANKFRSIITFLLLKKFVDTFANSRKLEKVSFLQTSLVKFRLHKTNLNKKPNEPPNPNTEEWLQINFNWSSEENIH